MMLRVLLLSFVLAWSMPLDAQSVSDVRSQLESSLRLTGSIVIETDGKVLEHSIKPTPALTPALTAYLDRAISSWRFEPVKVDGKVVRAKAPMHLRLVAKKTADGKYNVTIASTYFGSNETSERLPSQGVRSDGSGMKPPSYPKGLVRAGVEGTVYLVVQVGRDGRVMNVDASQVNLRAVGTARVMEQMRNQLAEASVHAARSWRFIVPTTGEEAGKSSWLAFVPISFNIGRELRPLDQWDTYVPGPLNNHMPWADERVQMAASPDALPDSGVFPLEQGAKLLTPPAA